jgi:mannose-6-phosphate isomerase-like protein (cupin superfamily)
MSKYLKQIPDTPTFTQEGLQGFQYPLELKQFEVYFVDSTKGHDDFVIAEGLTHTYYILEGNGTFEIGADIVNVSAGNMLEIPPKIEFSYSGKMKLLLLMSPPFAEGKVESTKPNSKVV